MMTEAERLAAYDPHVRRPAEGTGTGPGGHGQAPRRGKESGTTYQQLLAQKLTVQNLIGRFEIYGIKEV